MATTRRPKDDNPKGGSGRNRVKDTSKQRPRKSGRTGEGVERVRSDRGGKRQSSAVHPVHDRARADRPRRQSRNDSADGARDLRGLRSDRGSSGEEAGTARSGNYNINDWKVDPGFTDRAGKPLKEGAEVRFHSYSGNVMRAIVECDGALGRMINVRMTGDPFPTYVDHRQIQLTKRGQEQEMPTRTSTAPTAKELRRQAKAAGVRNWEEMSREELQAAIDSSNGDGEDAPRPAKTSTRATKGTSKATSTAEKPARAAKAATEAPAKRTSSKTASKATSKATSSKSTSKAKAAPRPAPAADSGPNPFRPNSNLWHVTQALMQGGKRSALVKKLLPKMEYNPRVQDSGEFNKEAETDRRLKVVGYILKNQHGWDYTHEGRGPDAYIKATPPGGDA